MRADDDGVTVSPLTAQSAPVVGSLYRAILAEAFPDLPGAAIDSYRDGWTAEVIAERAAAGWVMLAACARDGAPVGLCFGAPPEAGVGTVIWVLVADRARGLGVGARLVDAAAACYRERGAHKIKLTAPSTRARDFYLRNGFETEGLHRRHWFGADFWAMGRFLDGGQTET